VTGFDYIFLAIVALSVLLGLWRGLVSEVFALLGWMVALGLAWRGASWLEPMFLTLVSKTPWLAWGLAFLAIFVGVLIILAVARWFLRSLLEASGLSPLDRVLGACFGLARALVIALLLVAAGGMSRLPKESWWSEAVFAPPLETAVIALKPLFPKELGRRIKY